MRSNQHRIKADALISTGEARFSLLSTKCKTSTNRYNTIIVTSMQVWKSYFCTSCWCCSSSFAYLFYPPEQPLSQCTPAQVSPAWWRAWRWPHPHLEQNTSSRYSQLHQDQGTQLIHIVHAALNQIIAKCFQQQENTTVLYTCMLALLFKCLQTQNITTSDNKKGKKKK